MKLQVLKEIIQKKSSNQKFTLLTNLINGNSEIFEFKKLLSNDFKEYSKNVINNAKILSNKLIKNGFEIFSGGTDTHLMLVDLRKFNVTGKDAEASLVRSNITCNKNGIPFDTQSPMITSGIRLGTPACTTRGFGANEFNLIAYLISKVV